MVDAYIVYNPAAGRFPSRLLTERAADVLHAAGWNVKIFQTQGGPHITDLARQAVTEQVDAFFVAGGDGSINFAVRGLVDSDTALGVLPAGTANVWARELELPGLTWTRWTALEESAKRFRNPLIRKIDVGYCNENPFMLWAGVGLDAFVVHRIEPRSRWEKHFAVAHYASLALQQASVWNGLNLNVCVDGKELAGRFILGVVSNIHLYAGGFAEISPYALIDDGMMDLWLFLGDTVNETMRHIWDILSGRHVDSDKAICIPFRDLQLTSDSPLFAQLDGEPLKTPDHMSIRVHPNSLKVLVPENISRPLFADSLQ